MVLHVCKFLQFLKNLVMSFNWALERGIVIAMDLVYPTKPLGKLLYASRNVHLLIY